MQKYFILIFLNFFTLSFEILEIRTEAIGALEGIFFHRHEFLLFSYKRFIFLISIISIIGKFFLN